MREGAISHHQESFSAEGEKRQAYEEPLSPGAHSWGQKPDQQDELKLRSVFSSQLTQEHSGISCAFKAHVLIMTFDRLRLRRLAKSLAACKSSTSPRCGLLSANSQNHSCLKGSGVLLGQASDSGQQQRNQPQNEHLPSLELPSFGFLQQANLKSSQKFLNRQLFEYKLKVATLEGKVKGLERQLADAERRQQRQMVKKRESLASLAEQLGEKNEIIEELKAVIRGLKNRLNVKQNSSGLVLEEDSETLRKSLLHIEGVNDRLNFELSRTKQAEKTLAEQLKALSAQNDRLKLQINKLRQESFDVDSVREQAELGRRECVLWERRLKARDERLTILEKRINEKARNSQSAGIIAYCTEKRFESIPTPQPAHLDLSAKIQAILEFFFHIEEEDYQLRCVELFDAEQRELLQSQKAKICCRMENSNASRCLSPVKPKQEESQVVNFQFGCSILDLIQKESQKPVVAQEQSTSGSQEREIARLRERIGELKDNQLFVRSVLLSFIKSLELRSIKKESENILELLYDCYEYSEQERASLFPPKPRKIFGFI